MKYLAHAAVFTLFFDFYFSFELFSGGEGRLSQGVDIAGHYKKDTLTFRLKIADVVLFLLIISAFLQSKSAAIRPKLRSFFSQMAGFFVYSIFLLLLQYGELSLPQFSVSIIYLTKLLSIGFYYIFFCKYFSTHGERLILKSLVITSFLASILGILSVIVNQPFVITNRVEYYGQILIVELLLFSILMQENSASKLLLATSRPAAICIFLAGVVSIVMCGKRAPLLGLAVGCGYLTIRSFRARKNKRKAFAIIAMVGVGLLFFTELVSRTYVGDAPIADGLAPRYVESLRSNGWASGFSGFDRSTSERIAKIVLSLDLIGQHPLGIGFWSSIFRYDFLPDSGLQFVLENGVVLALLLALKIIFFWKELARGLHGESVALAAALRATIFAMLLVSLTVNVLYMFKIMSVFFILAALFHARNCSIRPKGV